MPRRRALLILNPNSRMGNADLTGALNRLREAGFEFDESKPADADDLSRLIQARQSSVDCVIVGGGDGAMRSVAEGVYQSRLPFGLLPLGTGNDLARTLMIPPNPIEAAGVIIDNQTARLDLGCVNGHYFFNVAHIGLGTRVTRNLSPASKLRWGVLSYPKAVLSALKNRRSFSAIIQSEGGRHAVRAIEIAVANGRHYGGGMTISQSATLHDQLLYLCAIKPLPLWKLLLMSFALRSGKHDGPGTQLLGAAQFRVETRRRMSVVADGDFICHTPAEFRVIKEAATAFVPDAYLKEETTTNCPRNERPHYESATERSQ